MADDGIFDRLGKILAGDASRRTILARVAGLLGGALLAMFGFSRRPAAAPPYDYQTLKSVGSWEVTKKSKEFCWCVPLLDAHKGDPQDLLVEYSLRRVPTAGADGEKTTVVTTYAKVYCLKPNNQLSESLVECPPNDDGSPRSAVQCVDYKSETLVPLGDKEGFFKKFGRVRLKDGILISSSADPSVESHAKLRLHLPGK